jgi:hypothetical protein
MKFELKRMEAKRRLHGNWISKSICQCKLQQTNVNVGQILQLRRDRLGIWCVKLDGKKEAQNKHRAAVY